MLRSMKFMAITTILKRHPIPKLCTLLVRVSRVAAVDHDQKRIATHVLRFDAATRRGRMRLREPTRRSHINPYR